MAVADNTIDECGTGRHTPPPTYQTLSRADGIRQIEYLLDPRNSIPNITPARTPDYTFKLMRIEENTEESANSATKICHMMGENNGISQTVRDIRQLLRVQDAILANFFPLLCFLFIIHLLLTLYNLVITPDLSLPSEDELKAVKKLNLSEKNMQIILNFAKRYVLLDLRNCLTQYLEGVQ